jgi:hypothetical protein
MRPTDLAGAEVRVGNWNSLSELAPGQTVTLDPVIDKSDQKVAGMSARLVLGSAGNPRGGFDADGNYQNGPPIEARLFNGFFDGDGGRPTVLEVAGIPYARYDVYCYRADDGDARASLFQIGDASLTIRGGAWNPESNGAEYVRSRGNFEAGNYVKFENLSGPTLKISCVAVQVPGGDTVLRNKVVGFQIVERK